MAGRKKIAVLTAQVESVYQKELLEGILDTAFTFQMEVVVFTTFVRDGVWESFHKGECNIYDLLSFEKIDGIILVPDSIRMNGKADEIMNEVREKFVGPVVTIDYPDYPFQTSEIDVTNAIHSMIEHLVTVHNTKDIAFMTGHKGHPHAEARLKAYRNAMSHFGLSIPENREFYGDFWYFEGEHVLDAMIQSEQGLPEAIACGSDPMGLSIYEACKSRGISVPDDLIITGYDVTEESSNQPYFLTSIKLDVKTVGKNAVSMLFNQLQNITKVELFSSVERLIIGHTCGCTPEKIRIRETPLDFCGSLYAGNNLGFYSGYNFMLEDTIGAPNLTECLWKIDYYTQFLKDIESFHICLCSDWCGNPQDETNYRKDGYSQNILWVYDKKKNRIQDGTEGWVDLNRIVKREEILPVLWNEREKPSVFYITPIHFMDRCFGYTVLEYSNMSVSYEREYSSFMRNTNNAFEAMRRQMNLQDMNVKLSQMYRLMEISAVKDSLTDLYNRNGFNIYAPELIEKAKLRGHNVLVFLADVNNLKKINDMYGHAEGDNAIKQAAKSISGIMDSKDTSTLCFRIGGDELVYLQIGEITEGDAEGLKLKIKKYLEEYNRSSGKAYQVMVSIGSSVGKAEGLHIDNLLQIADQKMYMEKTWYKNMYLNS